MKNILIIGCGLLGSSLLRRISKKKLSKKIFIYEKSKRNIAKIKNMLRLTIGSRTDSLKFIQAVEKIFNKWKIY